MKGIQGGMIHSGRSAWPAKTDRLLRQPGGPARRPEGPLTSSDVGTERITGPRCPCVLALDTSGSMEGAPIAELNRGLEQFSVEVLSSGELREAAEVALVAFGGSARVVREAAPLRHLLRSSLAAEGDTPLGEALQLSLEILERRLSRLNAAGVVGGTPWLIVMTDGQPTDRWRETAGAIRTLAAQGLMRLLVVGVGPGADMALLQELCPDGQAPVRMEGLRFAQFFSWLSASLALTALTSTTAAIPLPPPTSWAAPPRSSGGRR